MTTLPPVSPQVLSSNPQFRALYVQLTGEKENAESTGRPALLKPNGATAALVDESEAVDKDVKMYLSRAMRVKVLLKALAKVAGGGHDEAELDPHLRDLLSIVLLYLRRPTATAPPEDAKEGDDEDPEVAATGNDEVTKLLGPDIREFKENIHAYVPALSSVLREEVNSLKSLAYASAGASTKTHSGESLDRAERRRAAPTHNLESSLSEHLQARQHELWKTQEIVIPNAQRRLVATTITLLNTQADLLEKSLLLLSRGKHGALSRAQKARAELLRTEAACVDVQARLKRAEAISKIYTDETRVALARYRDHLMTLKDDLEMQKREAVAALEEEKL